MFNCGHGTCKECFKHLQQNLITQNISFSCPLCREHEQPHTTGFLTTRTDKWTTFAEWYNDFEVYINSGVANNVVKNSSFGKHLMRLIKESKPNKSKPNKSKPNKSKPNK